MEGDGEWMFAYGSNMNDGVLLERRGLVVHESVPGRLSGYRLAFNMPGMPWVEPAFANVEPEAGAEVHGVLRRMPLSAIRKLDAMEGGGHAYERIYVEAETYRGDEVQALIYRGIRTRPGERPSARYLRLLMEGARQHDLEEDWVQRLEGVPTARETWLNGVAVSLVELMLKLDLPMTPIFEASWSLIDAARQARVGGGR